MSVIERAQRRNSVLRILTARDLSNGWFWVHFTRTFTSGRQRETRSHDVWLTRQQIESYAEFEKAVCKKDGVELPYLTDSEWEAELSAAWVHDND